MKFATKKRWQRCFRPACSSEAGFTLAETLAALLFMAIVLPVVFQGLTLANRSAVVAERQALASRLGNNLLNELVATEQWQNAQQSGTFAPDYPRYRWQLESRDWTQDTMRELTLVVTYPVQGVEHHAVLSTLVSTSE